MQCSHIAPAVKALNAVVVLNHIGQLNTGGQEGCDDNIVVAINKGCAVKIGNIEGNLCAESNGSIFSDEDVNDFANECSDYLIVNIYNGCKRSKSVEIACYTVENCFLYIINNFFFEHECRVACIDVAEAKVSKHSAVLGCQQTVCNTEGVALYKVVSNSYAFCLVLYCSVEVCNRISGSCCLVEEEFQIEFVTLYLCKLFDNIVNGRIVNSCGQTVGNFFTGNVFELLYKCFESGNGCKIINKRLCLEVVGEVITGYAFNVSEKNLCIRRSERSVVCRAKGCRLYCVENDHDLFHSNAFYKCDQIAGALCVNVEDLILNEFNLGVVGFAHFAQSDANNGSDFGGKIDIYNKFVVCKTDVAKLIHNSGKLCCGVANEFYAGSENKVNVELLGYNLGTYYTVFVARNCEAGGKELAGLIEVCKFLERRKHVFENGKKLSGIQFNAIAILNGNNFTVYLNVNKSCNNGVDNIGNLIQIGFGVELCGIDLAKDGLSNAGFVSNLDERLEIDLGDNCTVVDILNKCVNVDNLSDFTVLEDFNCDGVDIQVAVSHVSFNVDVLDNRTVAAKRLDNCIETEVFVCKNCIKDNTVVSIFLEASDHFCGCNVTVCKSGCDLRFNNTHICDVSISAVIGSVQESIDKRIYRDNLIADELVHGEDTVCGIQHISYINSAFNSDDFSRGKERRYAFLAENHSIDIKYVCYQEIRIESNNLGILHHCANVTAVLHGKLHCCHHTELILNDGGYSGGVSDVTHKSCRIYTCEFSRSLCAKSCNNNLLVNDSKHLVQEVGVHHLLFSHEDLESGLVNVGVSQFLITDGCNDEINLCSSCEIDTIQGCDSLLDVNELEKNFGIQLESQVQELCRVVCKHLLGIEIVERSLEIIFAKVVHYDAECIVLNVSLQVHTGEDFHETFFVYTLHQFVCINTGNQCAGVDFDNHRRQKRENFLFGKNCQNFFRGQNIADIAADRKTRQKTAQVTGLQVGEKRLGINRNGNVGRRYVSGGFLVGFYAHPAVSKYSCRQQANNHNDRQQHSEQSVELFHNTKPHFV